MMQLILKPLLIANYCIAKWLVNKKLPENIIPATIWSFLTPITFIAIGLYFIIIGSIDFKFKSYTPIFIGLVIIGLSIGYGLQKTVKKAIFKWDIEKKYKILTKNERRNKCILAFLFFWGSFALFFYLGVKFIGGYSVN